jgi:uncharacterized protein (TIGR01244 family)
LDSRFRGNDDALDGTVTVTDPDDIRAWQRLSNRITTSGRLLPDDPARLAAIGVKRIVNLALDTHPEALADEADLCAALGLSYTHIPIPFDAPREAHFEAFRAVLASDEAPVHVHCIANWRVSACFYRYNRDIMGMAEQEARALMAQQWEPETSDYPGADAWTAFIAAEMQTTEHKGEQP